jgi:hypothetical protein
MIRASQQKKVVPVFPFSHPSSKHNSHQPWAEAELPNSTLNKIQPANASMESSLYFTALEGELDDFHLADSHLLDHICLSRST